MSRVAVCLFFIAIFHYGIVISSADEPTTEGSSKNTEETTAKPAVGEPKESEDPVKEEAEDKTGVTTKTETKIKDDKPTEGKSVTVNESKKEDVTEKTINTENRKFTPDILKGNPLDQTKVFFEFPKNILGHVNAVGAKINEVVAKGLDTAKNLAGGTFNFFSTTANNPSKNQ